MTELAQKACRYHTTFRLISSSPLLFADEVAPTPLTLNPQLPSKLQARLYENERPYSPARALVYAQRWTGYCNTCFPRITTTQIKSICGVFEPCKCGTKDLERMLKVDWTCVECWERKVGALERDWEGRVCGGRACGRRLMGENEGFQAVCEWCLCVLDEAGWEGTRAALREGQGFEA